jgi:tetratricopeptide (TPR) repeat protein
MKKNLVRAVLVASLSLFFAGAAFTATPAVAADAKDAAKPKISKALSKPLSDAQKAFAAKDWATMIAKMKEAQALTDLTDYDKYIVNYFSGLAYYNSGDKASATPYFVAAAESAAPPPEDQATALRIALDLENDAKDYAKVIELGQRAAKAGPVDGGVAAEVAIAYYETGDFANAKVYAQKSIDAATAAGKIPERAAYQIIMNSQSGQKDIPGAIKTLEMMSNLYGAAEDWGRLIDVSLGSLPAGSKAREVAALYMYRLRLTVGADTSADDYLLMNDMAMGQHYPGDAVSALEKGLDSGKVGQAKGAGLLAKAKAAANADQGTLAAADAVAAKSPSSNGDVSVAEDYYGYAMFPDAVRVAQRAIAKGGAKAAEAQLLLGVAQAQLGDNATATQSLALVKGDPALERAAYLWTIYTTRKYGAAAAPAPTGK